jgi:predicted nuclease of predicted toxin-antitoxin system
VRVLLDECLDWRLARHISGHYVKSIRQMSWTGVENGELIALAARSFDVLVTVDQNISFQQNLATYPIAIVIVRARTNQLVDLKPLVPPLLLAIERAKPGAIEIVS